MALVRLLAEEKGQASSYFLSVSSTDVDSSMVVCFTFLGTLLTKRHLSRFSLKVGGMVQKARKEGQYRCLEVMSNLLP